MMIALVADGEAVASWIYQPARDAMYTAVLGAGATRNGDPLRVSPNRSEVHAELRGDVLRRFLPDDLRSCVDGAAHRFASVDAGTKCAGIDYPSLIDGGRDFIVYWRTLPWDHVPGALLLTEAGGVAVRVTGEPYVAASPGDGLIAAANAPIAATIMKSLLGL